MVRHTCNPYMGEAKTEGHCALCQLNLYGVTLFPQNKANKPDNQIQIILYLQ